MVHDLGDAQALQQQRLGAEVGGVGEAGGGQVEIDDRAGAVGLAPEGDVVALADVVHLVDLDPVGAGDRQPAVVGGELVRQLVGLICGVAPDRVEHGEPAACDEAQRRQAVALGVRYRFVGND